MLLPSRLSWRAVSLLAIALCGSRATAAPDFKFDVVTLCCPCDPTSSICQPQFDHLNFPSTNGHFIAMGTDAHRFELATNGNALAIYYNTFNDGWTTNTGASSASNINQYAVANFTSTGPRPDWVVLNEISSGLWPSDSTYRAWVRDTIHALRATYGFNVILFSPFTNPGSNGSDWQAVAADAYIAIENYLSGAEVKTAGYSVSYCQGQYQGSVTSYGNMGVSKSRLMLGEHFAQSTSGASYGRSGVASNEWDTVIPVRNQAAQNVAFAGFLTYAWGGNDMLVSTNEIIHFEDTYRTNLLPFSAGVTAPYAVVQPAGQIAPSGSMVSFIVFQAGTAPTTFQWRLNGTNIPGATASSLNLTNVQVANAGNYSVAFTNSAGGTVSSNAFLDVDVPPPITYEPFSPAVTAYTPGASLAGQTNALGQYWSAVGPTSTTQAVVQAGSLAVPGLAGPAGNSVKFGQNGQSARFNLGTAIMTGTIYYSLGFRLTDVSTLNAGGVFWAGFNNSQGSQPNTPTSIGTRLLTRSATGGYNIGLDKSSGNVNGFVFSPTVYTTNDTIFVVGSYTFNSTATNDDVCQMWINPPVSTFGAAVAPTPTLVCTATNDPFTQISSFVLFDRNANEPAGIIADEIRVGASWASTTPPAEVAAPPALNLQRNGSTIVLSWTTNAPGFVLQSAAALTNGAAWNDVQSLVYVVNGSFTVTNPAAGGQLFYRLREPQ
jgi:hypothetical protein